MPQLGTITKILFKNGDLIEMGGRLRPISGSIHPEYDGQIVGIFYVSGDDVEPEHYDVLAVPHVVFAAMMKLASGADAEKVYAEITAHSIEMRKRNMQPSAIRRIYHVGEGGVLMHESSLSMQQAFDHYQDRFIAAATAYDGDDDDDGTDGASQPDASAPAPVNGQAAVAPGA